MPEHLFLELGRPFHQLFRRHCIVAGTLLPDATLAFPRGRIRRLHDVRYLLDDRRGLDAVFAVIRQLPLAAPLGLVDRTLHRAGHLIGVKNRGAVDVPRCASDRLDQ